MSERRITDAVDHIAKARDFVLCCHMAASALEDQHADAIRAVLDAALTELDDAKAVLTGDQQA